VTGGNPPIPAPQPRVIGQRLAGEKSPDHGRQLIGPFQRQAGEPERLHDSPDDKRVLPYAVHLAQQQQTAGIQRPLGRSQRRRLDHQAEILDHELVDFSVECIQRRNARHAFSIAPILAGRGPGRVKRAALPGLAQPLLGVFGQEIAQRDATARGLGREPPGKVIRKHDGAVHAVVALPAFVPEFRHAPSFPIPAPQRR
jgi:hypothetical protein